jgi:hypothetical protein
MLAGLQPVLVHLSKNKSGKFSFNPISVNLMTEICKVIFALTVLLFLVGMQCSSSSVPVCSSVGTSVGSSVGSTPGVQICSHCIEPLHHAASETAQQQYM